MEQLREYESRGSGIRGEQPPQFAVPPKPASAQAARALSLALALALTLACPCSPSLPLFRRQRVDQGAGEGGDAERQPGGQRH
eukprot:3106162-Prymnesium_polylepis.1